jgi:hypothetical protein
MVGHWALALVCRPLALVKQLMGRDPSHDEMACERVNHARLQPGVIFLDSMASSGLGWRRAIAGALLQYHAESYPSQNLDRASGLLDIVLAAELGPQVSAPHQDNLWSCALYLLKNVQLVVRDIVKPSLAYSIGLTEGSPSQGQCEMLSKLDTIINRDWYTSNDAEVMLSWLKESATRFVPLPTDNSEIQESNSDGDVFLDEIATARENMNRRNRLTAEVMRLLGSVRIQELNNNSEANQLKLVDFLLF